MILLLLSLTHAAEAPVPPLERDEPDVIIDVVEPVWATRDALSRRLRDLGYLTQRVRDDRTVFHHDTPWHPSVHLLNDGRFEIRRGPVRVWHVGLTEEGRTTLGKHGTYRLDFGIPLPRSDFSDPTPRVEVRPLIGIVPDALLASKKRVRSARRNVLEAARPEFEAWSASVAAFASTWRLEVELPQRLHHDLSAAPSTERGYADLVRWGCTRTDTPEGDAARAVAADVLSGAFPVTHGGYDVDWDELCGTDDP